MKKMIVNSNAYGRLEVKLDDEDFDKVIVLQKWSASKDRGKYYFHKRLSKTEKMTLHRFLMGLPTGKYVDHINKDNLDNRKVNLRICSNGANIRNGKVRPNNTSGYAGVHFDKSRNKWHSTIKVMYKNIFLGRFVKKQDAVEARQKAEKKYFNI